MGFFRAGTKIAWSKFNITSTEKKEVVAESMRNTDFHCLMYLSIVKMNLEGVQNNSLHFSICACHPGRVPMLCSKNNKLLLKSATGLILAKNGLFLVKIESSATMALISLLGAN